MVNKVSVDQLRLQIEALIREYPDLADDEILRANMLESETELTEVLSELYEVADETKDLVAGATLRMKRLKEETGARRARLERRVEFLRELMLRLMQSANLRKLELPQVTLSQRVMPPQIVGEVDVSMLPDDLCRIKVEPDRDAIRKALLAGREIPGLALSNSPPGLLVNPK